MQHPNDEHYLIPHIDGLWNSLTWDISVHLYNTHDKHMWLAERIPKTRDHYRAERVRKIMNGWINKEQHQQFDAPALGFLFRNTRWYLDNKYIAYMFDETSRWELLPEHRLNDEENRLTDRRADKFTNDVIFSLVDNWKYYAKNLEDKLRQPDSSCVNYYPNCWSRHEELIRDHVYNDLLSIDSHRYDRPITYYHLKFAFQFIWWPYVTEAAYAIMEGKKAKW